MPNIDESSIALFPNSLELKETVLRTNALLTTYQKEKEKLRKGKGDSSADFNLPINNKSFS